MNLDWARVLPIGLVLFAASALGALLRRAGRSRAQRSYPALAQRLELRLEAPRYAGWVGKLSGMYRGRAVLVQPDESSRVVLHLRARTAVDVRSFEHWKRVPEGYEAFSLGTRRLDLAFPNRLILLGHEPAPALAQALAALKHSTPQLKTLTLAQDRLECGLTYGSPAFIPVNEVERLLGVLSDVAGAAEQSPAPVDHETTASAAASSAGAPNP